MSKSTAEEIKEMLDDLIAESELLLGPNDVEFYATITGGFTHQSPKKED